MGSEPQLEKVIQNPFNLHINNMQNIIVMNKKIVLMVSFDPVLEEVSYYSKSLTNLLKFWEWDQIRSHCYSEEDPSYVWELIDQIFLSLGSMYLFDD